MASYSSAYGKQFSLRQRGWRAVSSRLLGLYIDYEFRWRVYIINGYSFSWIRHTADGVSVTD